MQKRNQLFSPNPKTQYMEKNSTENNLTFHIRIVRIIAKVTTAVAVFNTLLGCP